MQADPKYPADADDTAEEGPDADADADGISTRKPSGTGDADAPRAWR